MFDRRQFLAGIFGTAAIAAAGPLPKILETFSEPAFKSAFAGLPRQDEIYSNGIEYAQARIEWLDEKPWFKIIIPEGFYPLREESDRIGARVIAELKGAANG